MAVWKDFAKHTDNTKGSPKDDTFKFKTLLEKFLVPAYKFPNMANKERFEDMVFHYTTTFGSLLNKSGRSCTKKVMNAILEEVKVQHGKKDGKLICEPVIQGDRCQIKVGAKPYDVKSDSLITYAIGKYYEQWNEFIQSLDMWVQI